MFGFGEINIVFNQSVEILIWKEMKTRGYIGGVKTVYYSDSDYDEKWEISEWDRYCDSFPYVRPVPGFIPNSTIDTEAYDSYFQNDLYDDDDNDNDEEPVLSPAEIRRQIIEEEQCMDSFFGGDCDGKCSECRWWVTKMLKQPDSYIKRLREEEKRRLPLPMFLKLRDEGKFSWS